MSNEESNQQQRRQAEKDTDPRVDLAVERTELALEDFSSFYGIFLSFLAK